MLDCFETSTLLYSPKMATACVPMTPPPSQGSVGPVYSSIPLIGTPSTSPVNKASDIAISTSDLKVSIPERPIILGLEPILWHFVRRATSGPIRVVCPFRMLFSYKMKWICSHCTL